MRTAEVSRPAFSSSRASVSSVRGAAHGQNDHRGTLLRSKAFRDSKELPGGTFWLPAELAKHDIVYGQDFVLQRPKQGGPGLVASSKDCHLECRESVTETQLAVRPQRAESHVVRAGQSLWDVTDITDYTFLGDAGLLPGSRAPFMLPAAAASLETPSSSCTGMILHPAFQRPLESDEGPDLNPRRTKKVKFTCKKCNTTSTKRVSPHGWHSGTVFARCEGCQIVHKLVDNLNIFHELTGEVFTEPPPKDLKIPPGLPQKPTIDYHVHPAIYPLLPKD